MLTKNQVMYKYAYKESSNVQIMLTKNQIMYEYAYKESNNGNDHKNL